MAIEASRWRPGQQPESVCLDGLAPNGDDVLVLRVESTAVDAYLVHAELVGICGPALSLEMVEDLLDPDEVPTVERLGPDGQIRKVSSFGLRAVGATHATAALVFEPVEFLSTEKWMIYYSHPRVRYEDGVVRTEPVGQSQEADLVRRVSSSWVKFGGNTTGDIGVLFLRALANDYSAGRRTLWNALNAWEREFYARDANSETLTFAGRLTEMHRLHSELRGRLDALNVPRDRADRAWFQTGLEQVARRVDEVIDDLLRDLRNFSDSLRQAMVLTQNHASLRHFQLAEEQKQRSEQMQSGLELVAALLLVPTLIAGIYGANTRIPGGGQWIGFYDMLALMFVGSTALYLVLRRLRVKAARRASSGGAGH